MKRILFQESCDLAIDENRERILFIDDSPNDSPIFNFFSHSVGVANVLDFEDQLTCAPARVTALKGGHGFAEMVEHLLA